MNITAALLTVWLISLTMPVLAETAQPILIGAFSLGELQAWQPQVFKGKTNYQLLDSMGPTQVLKAVSQDSGSGLVKKQRIDLTKTPIMTWRWLVDNVLPSSVPERTKAGDDYPARVYVIVDGGMLFWQTKSINYVWASNIPKQTVWANAYAGDAVKMLALRSRADVNHTWITERRNVREDFKRLMGFDVQAIDAVAIMTDTDNSHSAATAYYGDIQFSAE